MKELKKQIMKLLKQKLSAYGFKKKQYFLIRTVKEGNVVQIIAPGFAHGVRQRISVSISVAVIYKDINNEAIKFGELNRLKHPGAMEITDIGYHLINEIDRDSIAAHKGRLFPIIYYMRNEKERALEMRVQFPKKIIPSIKQNENQILKSFKFHINH